MSLAGGYSLPELRAALQDGVDRTVQHNEYPETGYTVWHLAYVAYLAECGHPTIAATIGVLPRSCGAHACMFALGEVAEAARYTEPPNDAYA